MSRLLVKIVLLAGISYAGWRLWEARNEPDTPLDLGRQAMADSDYASAIVLLEDAAAQDPGDLAIQLDLATCYDRMGDRSSALACYLVARPLLDEPGSESMTMRRHRDRFAVLIQSMRRAEAEN